jgi:hypothetical protein
MRSGPTGPRWPSSANSTGRKSPGGKTGSPPGSRSTSPNFRPCLRTGGGRRRNGCGSIPLAGGRCGPRAGRADRGHIGRDRPPRGGKRATALGAVAAQAIGVTSGAEAARYQLQAYLRGWRWARAIRARTEARPRELVTQTGYGDVLLSLPGFGPVVGAPLLGWRRDLTRFADPRQALKDSRAGLDPAEFRASLGCHVHQPTGSTRHPLGVVSSHSRGDGPRCGVARVVPAFMSAGGSPVAAEGSAGRGGL